MTISQVCEFSQILSHLKPHTDNSQSRQHYYETDTIACNLLTEYPLWQMILWDIQALFDSHQYFPTQLSYIHSLPSLHEVILWAQEVRDRIAGNHIMGSLTTLNNIEHQMLTLYQ